MTTPSSATLHLCDWCGASSDQPCLTGKGTAYKDGRSHHGNLCKCPDPWAEPLTFVCGHREGEHVGITSLDFQGVDANANYRAAEDA